jgi:hypothetical protein
MLRGALVFFPLSLCSSGERDSGELLAPELARDGRRLVWETLAGGPSAMSSRFS